MSKYGKSDKTDSVESFFFYDEKNASVNSIFRDKNSPIGCTLQDIMKEISKEPVQKKID